MAVAIVVGGIIAVVASGGVSLSIIGPVLTVLKTGVIAGVITFCVSGYIANAVLPEDFVLPQIKLTPYEIFANQVPLFDVDFFNPKKDIETNTYENEEALKIGILSENLEETLKELRYFCYRV